MKKMIGKVAIAASALSLAVVPAVAQVSASQALSLRAATATDDSSEAAPPTLAIIGLVAILGAGIYIAVDGDDSPDSP